MEKLKISFFGFNRFATAGKIIPKMKEFGERKGIRYIVHADIKNFYDSFYLHANSWSILGSKKQVKHYFVQKSYGPVIWKLESKNVWMVQL